MPCHTCYDQENCRANALISLLFKEKSLSDINEGLIGCYYTWHEFDKAHFNESRRVDYIEDLIIYGWTKNVVSLSHTIYMMNTIVKQTTVILDEGEDTETIGNLCINHPYNNSRYVERMERLWTLGRASVEEIYYLLTHPKKDGPTIDVDFIFNYNRTMFLLFRSEDELKEVERDERDDDAWDRVSEWLEDDDQHPPSDSELPFLGGRTVPIENENLTDEQRTIEWATSLGGGANNL